MADLFNPACSKRHTKDAFAMPWLGDRACQEKESVSLQYAMSGNTDPATHALAAGKLLRQASARFQRGVRQMLSSALRRQVRQDCILVHLGAPVDVDCKFSEWSPFSAGGPRRFMIRRFMGCASL